MTNSWYPKAKEGFLSGAIDLTTDDVVIVLLADGLYTYTDAHEFLSSVDAGARLKTSAAVASKTVTGGVFKAASPFNIPDVPAGTCAGLIVATSTGDDATSRLLVYIDGDERIDVAAAAESAATTLVVEDLQTAVASGTVLTKISGTGPATITTSADATASDRSLTVVALSDAVVIGAVYEYQAGMFPLETTGGQVTIPWDATYGIAAL